MIQVIQKASPLASGEASSSNAIKCPTFSADSLFVPEFRLSIGGLGDKGRECPN